MQQPYARKKGEVNSIAFEAWITQEEAHGGVEPVDLELAMLISQPSPNLVRSVAQSRTDGEPRNKHFLSARLHVSVNVISAQLASEKFVYQQRFRRSS